MLQSFVLLRNFHACMLLLILLHLGCLILTKFLFYIPLSFPLALIPLLNNVSNKPSPVVSAELQSAKESVPFSSQLPVTCSKPSASEEWTLVTYKRRPRLAVESNYKPQAVCKSRQPCSTSGSLKKVTSSKRPVGFVEKPTISKNLTRDSKASTKRQPNLANRSHSSPQISFTYQPVFILPVLPLSQGSKVPLLGSQKQPPFILPGSNNSSHASLSSPSTTSLPSCPQPKDSSVCPNSSTNFLVQTSAVPLNPCKVNCNVVLKKEQPACHTGGGPQKISYPRQCNICLKTYSNQPNYSRHLKKCSK